MATAVTGSRARSTEKRRTGIRRSTCWSMLYGMAFENTPTSRQATSRRGDVQTSPLPGAPNGISTMAPIARPTPRPVTPRLAWATRDPITM